MVNLSFLLMRNTLSAEKNRQGSKKAMPFFSKINCLTHRMPTRSFRPVSLIVCIVLFFLFTPMMAICQASGTRFIGNVIDKSSGQPMQFVTLKLQSVSDSSVVDGSITDSAGKFNLKAKAVGNYFISITLVGYEPTYIQAVVVDSQKKQMNLGNVEMTKSTKKLGDLIVKDNNLIQVDVDKIVYKIANTSVGTSGTAGDVLQTLPSVFVNLEGDVTVRGGKVRLYIDGRPSGVFGISRSQVLNYIPASMIERVEVIKDPSSKYDADGGNGIINLVLKTDQAYGFNGLLILGGGTGSKANGSVNVSNNYKRWKLFGSYDGRTAIMGNFESRHRESTPNGITKTVNQERYNVSHTLQQNLRFKASFIPNKKNAFDLTFLHANMRDHDIVYYWYKHLNEAQKLTRLYDRIIDEEQIDQSNNLSAHYSRKFKKSSQVLTADASFLASTENTNGDLRQQYYNLDLSVSTKPPYLYRTNRNVNEKNVYCQVDYVHPIRKNMKTEMGIKTRYRVNQIQYQLLNFDYATNAYFEDTLISNDFNYALNINAGYLTLRNKIKKNSYKLGLRAEQSTIRYKLGNQITPNEQKFINFFPSLNLLHDFNKNSKLTFQYSRRIDRPNFNELNPIQKLNDTIFIERGNPSLIPKIINHVELSHVLNANSHSFTTSLYYIHTNKDIQKVSVLDTNGVTTTNYQNLKTSDQLGFDVSTFLQPAAWCRVNASLSFYHNQIDGSNVLPNFIANYFAYNAKFNCNFILPKKFYFQVDGSYQSSTSGPFVRNKPQYYADLSVKKDLDHRRFTLAMRLSDIFWTQRRNSEFSGVNFLVNSNAYRRSRILVFSLTYRPFVKRIRPEDNKLEDEETDDTGHSSDE